MTKSVSRCRWAEGVSLNYIEYHDKEWGVPVWDDQVSNHGQKVFSNSMEIMPDQNDIISLNRPRA